MPTAANPIPWDNTSWADVNAYIDAHDAPPRFSAEWWRRFLFVDDPTAPIAEALHLSPDPMGDVIKSAETGAQDAAASAAEAVGNAAGNAASTTWAAVAPYVAVGALAFIAFQMVKAR
jgi:hypothetical protein